MVTPVFILKKQASRFAREGWGAHPATVPDFGREIALRFPRRRAQRQATEQWRCKTASRRIAPLLNAARMAQRAIPTRKSSRIRPALGAWAIHL